MFDLFVEALPLVCVCVCVLAAKANLLTESLC